jgi:methylated-DNA-protein-cysteine methyltransferase-like protein
LLSSSSAGHDLPWHRVVNRAARISLRPGNGYELQRDLLQREGVEFGEDDTIDFSRFLWWPEPVFLSPSPKK